MLASKNPVRGTSAAASVEIDVDQTYFVPPDQRELGIVLTSVGFR